MHYPIITGIFLGVAVLLAILCSIALLVMPDTFARLHYSGPIVAISSACIAVAVWVNDGSVQSRIKVTLIALMLPVFSAILTQATAQAARVRQEGHWALRADEPVPILGDSRATEITQEPTE